MVGPHVAAVADVGQLDLSPRKFRTKFGGLLLFVPYLSSVAFDKLIKKVGLPGSKMIPAAHAMRSLLALKLFGNARHSHVMSEVLDEGLGLFAGLNVIPKRAFLTKYSCRIDPACYPKLMPVWFDAVGKLGLERGSSFDLDFHTIPFHGEAALVENHYVSKRSRRQKGVLAFLAQDADTRVFCYANGQVRKDEQDDEILRFIAFWKKRTGRFPEEVIFDSKLTTYNNLNKLDKKGIRFITLRRRTRKMLHEIHAKPRSAWRRIELHGRPILGPRHESQLRPPTHTHGQQPLPSVGNADRRRLSKRPIPPSVPRLHTRCRPGDPEPKGNHGPLPKACPQPLASRRRL